MIVCLLDVERTGVYELAERFGRIGEIAINGNNRERAKELCSTARVRIGGGIRDAQTALDYLRAGAERVIIEAAATPELLAKLPRERVIVALDSGNEAPLDVVRRLNHYCGGFLLTTIDLEYARRVRSEIQGTLTVAGGIASIEQIRELDRLGIDTQLGTVNSAEALDPVDAFCALANFERGEGLLPTVVSDARDGGVRMLAYSTPETLAQAVHEGKGVYWSRSRNEIWRKGDTSGNQQRLMRVALDCDRDAAIFFVQQSGATCHTGAERCFGNAPFSWYELLDRIDRRAQTGAAGSYTRRLLSDPQLLRAKIMEEAQEVVEAASRDELAWECADLLYFMSVRMREVGVGIADVMAQLASRAS